MKQRIDNDFYKTGLEPKPLKRKWLTEADNYD